MDRTTRNLKISQTLSNVNPPQIDCSPPVPEPVIHHNVPERRTRIIIFPKDAIESIPYGVSPSTRVLSPGVLLKKFDAVRDCLEDVLGLTCCQREVVLELLRLWAYYGKVYPKAQQFDNRRGGSRATFWRVISKLERLGVIRRVNRYVLRPHAQISNLYLLHNLIIVLARYLAEHGQSFKSSWVMPWLTMTGSVFWPLFWSGRLTAFFHQEQPVQSSP